MSDFKKQYQLWDEFIGLWPLSELSKMTLEQYTKAGAKDTFTYWLEFRLAGIGMGSIAGGSAFKFGVFSRKDTDSKPSDSKLSYSDTYAWYSSLGNTAEAAFEQVLDQVQQIAKLAAQGDVDGVEKLPYLGSATKWKIAFHYQNRQSPVMVGILTKPSLEVFLGGIGTKLGIDPSMATLQKAAVIRRPADLGILEFGRQIWEEWSRKNLVIWKLSHGDQPFTSAERQQLLDDQLVAVHRDTGKEQGKKFVEAPLGALFFLCHGNSPQRIGQFTSTAVPSKKGDGWLQRSYRVLKVAQRTDRYTANSKYWSPQGNSTFSQVGSHDMPEFESTLLKHYFGIDLAELAAIVDEPVDADGTNIGNSGHPSEKEGMDSESRGQPFNRIYYGPPGTGKTFQLSRLLKLDYEQAMTSVSTEEWRSQVIAEKIAILKWWEGSAAALYELGGKAKVNELAEHRFIKAMVAANASNRNVRQTLWRTLQNHTVDESTTVKMKKRLSPAIFDKSVDSVWHFAGEWKDACEDLIELVDQLGVGHQDAGAVQRYSFVTFHQSYGYEEFVEGLRPMLDGDVESGEIQYEIRSGVFKELCRKARLAPDQRFAMVIDEINRGNISKIFGELITLIEPDKREGAEHCISVTLPYSGEFFSVPANIDIIGAMNTADRSLALLDTALRRRFDFVPLMPDARDEPGAPLHNLRVTFEDKFIDIPRMLAAMNERVEALYDRDHGIGHAYFTTLKNVADGEDRFVALKQVFRNRIVPLLEEYFFEDWQKIRLVLADNQKPDALRFVNETQDHEIDLTRLFGGDHGLDAFTTKRRYAVQEAAFTNPDAYIRIYQIQTP